DIVQPQVMAAGVGIPQADDDAAEHQKAKHKIVLHIADIQVVGKQNNRRHQGEDKSQGGDNFGCFNPVNNRDGAVIMCKIATEVFQVFKQFAHRENQE